MSSETQLYSVLLLLIEKLDLLCDIKININSFSDFFMNQTEKYNKVSRLSIKYWINTQVSMSCSKNTIYISNL